MPRSFRDLSWTAPKTDTDWIDEDVLRALALFESFVDTRKWKARQDAVKQRLDEAWPTSLNGAATDLFDPRDKLAWAMFQARAYAADRGDWIPEESAMVSAILTKIGQSIPTLLEIGGVEDRLARVMTDNLSHPDGGFYELLVALAYRRHGWSVDFIPEIRGGPKTPDLRVRKGNRRFVVECKRPVRSALALQEKARIDFLARPVHEQALESGRSIILECDLRVPAASLPDDYFLGHTAGFIANPNASGWSDAMASGRVREVDWRLARNVLSDDFVYYGASRMIELIAGGFDHEADHSFRAHWRPHPELRFWADAVYQASLVSVRHRSPASVSAKARDFSRYLREADAQLGQEAPGVLHVGIETWAGDRSDAERHIRNIWESRMFEPRRSRLRLAYANYFAPVLTTRPDESAALNETTGWYRIGNHKVERPLREHLLLAPETGMRAGQHWDGTADEK